MAHDASEVPGYSASSMRFVSYSAGSGHRPCSLACPCRLHLQPPNIETSPSLSALASAPTHAKKGPHPVAAYVHSSPPLPPPPSSADVSNRTSSLANRGTNTRTTSISRRRDPRCTAMPPAPARSPAVATRPAPALPRRRLRFHRFLYPRYPDVFPPPRRARPLPPLLTRASRAQWAACVQRAERLRSSQPLTSAPREDGEPSAFAHTTIARPDVATSSTDTAISTSTRTRCVPRSRSPSGSRCMESTSSAASSDSRSIFDRCARRSRCSLSSTHSSNSVHSRWRSVVRTCIRNCMGIDRRSRGCP
ncbi:hypothetical protein C8R45DRAFT_1038899 [Mycena sanguinolenta]|nr:hypothetical protein C8R45DRAFT_1038899 [Mycena sanguinolenta]